MMSLVHSRLPSRRRIQPPKTGSGSRSTRAPATNPKPRSATCDKRSMPMRTPPSRATCSGPNTPKSGSSTGRWTRCPRRSTAIRTCGRDVQGGHEAQDAGPRRIEEQSLGFQRPRGLDDHGRAIRVEDERVEQAQAALIAEQLPDARDEVIRSPRARANPH